MSIGSEVGVEGQRQIRRSLIKTAAKEFVQGRIRPTPEQNKWQIWASANWPSHSSPLLSLWKHTVISHRITIDRPFAILRA